MIGRGAGRSKKAAEQEAARVAIEQMADGEEQLATSEGDAG